MNPIQKVQTRSKKKRASLILRFRIAISLMVLTLVLGTLGIYVLHPEDMSLIEAVYNAVVTISTVGYGDYIPQTDAERLFVVAFLVVGLGTISYTAAVVIGAIVEGEVQDALGLRKKGKIIEKLNNHIVICGCGRIGHELTAAFMAESIDCIVIESDKEALEAGTDEGFLMLAGDATQDDILKEAGIEHARSIVPVLASDADNLFIVISARQLNPNLTIVTRAEGENSAQKMIKAGANRVIRPLHIGAQHLAQAVLRPAVHDVIQHSLAMHDETYALEEVLVESGSPLVENSIRESGVGKDFRVIIVSIKRADGSLIFNPGADAVIQCGDTLVATGSFEQLAHLTKLASGKS